MIYENKTEGIFSVPTDWTITIAYEVGYESGKLKLQTWV